MARAAASCLLTLLLLAAIGCGRQTDPAPPLNETLETRIGNLPPVVIERPNVEGLPPVAPGRFLKPIAARVTGNPEEAAAEAFAKYGAPSEGHAFAIVLNDSDPRDLAEQLAGFMADNNIQAIAEALVPEQRDLVLEIHDQVESLQTSLTRIRTLVQSDAPSIADQLKPNDQGNVVLDLPNVPQPVTVPVRTAVVPATTGAIEVAAVTVDPADENKATATLRAAGTDHDIPLALERIDGKWRVRLPMTGSPDQMQGFVQQMALAARAFREAADQIEAGDVAPDAALDAIGQALRRAETGQPDSDTRTTDSADRAAEAEPAPAPNRRPNNGRRESLSGRDVDNEAPTVEELLGHQ